MGKSTSYSNGLATEALRYQTIGEAFDQVVARYPEHEALVVPFQNIRWSYREYQQQVDSLAKALVELGITKGDRVGIWAPNCYEWCVTQFATAKIGAIMVCINPAYRLYELEYALNKVACKALICAESFKTSHYLNMLQQLAPELVDVGCGELNSVKLPHLKYAIRLGEDCTEGFQNFANLLQHGSTSTINLDQIGNTLQADDDINIQFTSGTTGSPKGATLSHMNILNNGHQVAQGMNFSADDRLCIPVPLYHCFGMVMGNLACISHGATAVLPAPAFDPQATLATVSAEKCTALHGVPTMFIAQLEQDNIDDFDLTSLRTGIMAGAPCPEAIMRKVRDQMNMHDVTIMYGQTETSPVNHRTSPQDPLVKQVTTVGRVAPHLETKIIDADGAVLPRGEKGELCCRGYAVMSGYWADEQRTRETIDAAGWLHSGDLAIMDEEGFVAIVGRIKDMIIRGGENIYPREVEEFLYTHPEIQEVQVFGIDDKKYGEQVCAWVQLKTEAKLTEQDLLDYCFDQITHFKVPKYWRFVDEFPMTVTGKIQKFVMRQKMQASLAGVVGD